MVNTNAIFVTILARVINLKQSQASFLPHLTVWSYLKFAQMPISWDLAIFMPTTTTTTTTTDRQTNYFISCTCIRVTIFMPMQHNIMVENRMVSVLKCEQLLVYSLHATALMVTAPIIRWVISSSSCLQWRYGFGSGWQLWYSWSSTQIMWTFGHHILKQLCFDSWHLT